MDNMTKMAALPKGEKKRRKKEMKSELKGKKGRGMHALSAGGGFVAGKSLSNIVGSGITRRQLGKGKIGKAALAASLMLPVGNAVGIGGIIGASKLYKKKSKSDWAKTYRSTKAKYND